MDVLILLVVSLGLFGLGVWAITGTPSSGRSTPLLVKLLGILPLLGGLNLLLESFPWVDIPNRWIQPVMAIFFTLWGVGVIAHGTLIARVIGAIIVVLGVLALVDTLGIGIPYVGEALRQSLETLEQIFNSANQSYNSGR